MMTKYDIVIIGAGPAGLSCAKELQNNGKTVLLVEKHSLIGPKVCAGGLTTKIKNVGISLNSADLKFSSVKLHCQDKTKTISSQFPFVATIEREKLGQVMLSEITRKIKIRTDAEVTKIGPNFLEINGREKVGYDFLVGADGGNSLVRSLLGLKTRKFLLGLQYLVPKAFKDLEIFMDASLFGSGYAWIFPHKSYASIGCCQDARFLKNSSLRKNLDFWLKKQGIKAHQTEFQAKIINFDYRGCRFGRRFLVGDAAGFASGLTGEGIYFAVVSGREIARKILDAKYNCPKIKEILSLKQKHEILLFLMNFLHSLHPSWLNFSAMHILALLDNPDLVKKALKLYS